MSTELHWPRRATFVEPSADGFDDEERRFVGPGTFEVPDDVVDAYLDRGWERPEESEPAEAPEAASQEPDPDLDQEEQDEFDAGEFIDDSWQAVVASIEDGEADGHLAAVQEAEENREGDPRSSVLNAIESRRG